jgi:hypothetical protein
MRFGSNKLAAVSMGIVLLALVVQPAASIALAAALILTPVFLFGLVAAPRSLWPAADLEQPVVPRVLARATLFQRPPPASIL